MSVHSVMFTLLHSGHVTRYFVAERCGPSWAADTVAGASP